MEMNREMEEIRNRIVKSEPLIISRVPKKTIDEFKKFSNEEFVGDYGFTLKHIFDTYKGLIPTGLEGLEHGIEELNIRVAKLEGNVKEEKKETGRKMLDGRKRK